MDRCKPIPIDQAADSVNEVEVSGFNHLEDSRLNIEASGIKACEPALVTIIADPIWVAHAAEQPFGPPFSSPEKHW